MSDIKLNLPADVRCAVALSYDLEMCAGYAPDGVNHGRIMPALQAYTLRLCDVAERHGARLHFFYVCNGLQEPDIGYLEEIIDRGHIIDSHTYSHQGLTVVDTATLNAELAHANRLLRDRLEVTSTVLRGPGGYAEGWRTLPPANREAILQNGFQWVSGEYDDQTYERPYDEWVSAAERNTPYAYPEGLIEIPIQGWTDRMWFDMRPGLDRAALDDWRRANGHRPVTPGWRAPWVDLRRALDDWIALNRDSLDYAYAHHLLWVPVWHPYTQYLHDPDVRILTALLEHASAKPERAWVCTLRDAAGMLAC